MADIAIPRIDLPSLVELVFPDEMKKQKAAMTQVRRDMGGWYNTRLTLKQALEKLERYIKASTAKCLTSDPDWRQRFEASEVFKELPERLLAAQRLEREKRVTEMARRQVIVNVRLLGEETTKLRETIQRRLPTLRGESAVKLDVARVIVADAERVIKEVYEAIKDPDSPAIESKVAQ
jgi:hypothetical protein